MKTPGNDKTVINKLSTSHDDVAMLEEDTTVINNDYKSHLDGRSNSPQSGAHDSHDTDKTQFRPQAVNINPDVTNVAKKASVTRAEKVQTQHQSDTAGQTSQKNIRVLKGRFLLEKVLGVGGMGIVYKAKDRLKVEAQDRDPYVAIKVLSEEFRTHPEAFISLQRESRKTQRLSHQNIVKVYDFDRDGDVVFMTMEYMEGRPLDQMIRQYNATGLPRDDAWGIIKGLCSALSHAHAEKIIHSDFKPGNIFVTDSGMAKIFDFGIARAVTHVDRNDGKSIDKTVFDAGNLGALTPAYASLEMLKGKIPDIRDDVYALGCIIYEIFTGRHPFNKIPADEACNIKLKPKRIPGLRKKQWRAIEKSIAFKREHRIATVDELYKQLTRKYKPSYLLAASVLITVSALAVVFLQNNRQEQTNFSESDFRDEIEYKVRFDLYRKEIKRLLGEPVFSTAWEEDVWKQIQGASELLPDDDEWLLRSKREIYELYISNIRKERKSADLMRSKVLIQNAHRYTHDPVLLSAERNILNREIIKDEKKKQLLAKQHKELKITREKENGTRKKNVDSFNIALENVNQQLKCQSNLSMRNFDIAIKKLQSLDAARYKKIEKTIVSSLASCIAEVGERFPERATESKKYALRIFNNNRQIAGVKIIPRDSCDISIAGLGSYGKRNVCRDKIRGIGDGPDMVVIPGNRNIKPFAIGKYEISIGDFNKYCQATKECGPLEGADGDMPAINISISKVKHYLRWLSKQTKKKYRLPTKREWGYAANSTRKTRDPNRNCQFSSRGIQKGSSLVKATTGKQNPWGLVNHVGNAQEWVYGKGGKIVAVGGSYKDSMQECDITTVTSHTGEPDKITGFRILRELKDK